MITEYINITKGTDGKTQYLDKLFPNIPSNTILYKKLTGLGATYSEIKAKRDSIIIEPNVPPIIGKCKDPKHKNDNLFGVFEGVYTDDVVKYLEDTQKAGKRIKILTTPESFRKVKEAFKEVDISMKATCFLLFDECQKLIKDVDYREDITLPIDDFFGFEQKALVSATPIMPSDPRFEQHKFKVIELVPDFDYKEPISLLYTNNVLEALKRTLHTMEKQRTEERSICLFVNSTDMIFQLIEKMGIENDTTVFCAKKSVDKLRGYGFQNAFENWEQERMKKYNFFTSRFYAALDIEIDEQPDVIFVSEVYFAEHSMIDPLTDAIQAIGRFRNGVSFAVHIFNTNSDFPKRTREGIIEYLKESKTAYTTLKTLYNNATTIESRAAFKASMDSLPYNRMLDDNKKTNYFAIDNYINDALIKSAYSNMNKVIDLYNAKNTLFTIGDPRKLWCTLGDFDRLKIENKTLTLKEKRKEIVSQLELLEEDKDMDSTRSYIADLRSADPFIVDAYETIGKEQIEQYNYSYKEIKEAMIIKKYEAETNGTEFIQLVKNAFQVGQRYTRKFIKEELKRICELVKTAPRKAITATTIKEFFNVDECYIKKEKAFLIIESKI